MTLEQLNKITDTKIDELNPLFRSKIQEWRKLMLQAGVIPYIYTAYRSNSDQDKEYAKGRTIKGNITTYAQAGQSFHNYRLAIDWVPLLKIGENNYKADWDNNSAYKLGEKIARPLGIKYLNFETGHLQDGRFATWRDIKVK